jgi:hypothetical protein
LTLTGLVSTSAKAVVWNRGTVSTHAKSRSKRLDFFIRAKTTTSIQMKVWKVLKIRRRLAAKPPYLQ